jgi:tetratricopeptide (TPR) repeat protein
MSTAPMPEPLDDFLSRPPRLPPDPHRKEILFQETLRVRLPARPRRAPLAMMAAAAVVLAMLLSYVLWRPDKDAVPPDSHPKTDQSTQAARIESEKHWDAPAPPTQVASQPRDLEWRAFDAHDDQERARLYFQAGDLYLVAEQDIDAALRCYQQALRYSDTRELQFDPRDNWLVMALKNDRRKEP